MYLTGSRGIWLIPLLPAICYNRFHGFDSRGYSSGGISSGTGTLLGTAVADATACETLCRDATDCDGYAFYAAALEGTSSCYSYPVPNPGGNTGYNSHVTSGTVTDCTGCEYSPTKPMVERQ